MRRVFVLATIALAGLAFAGCIPISLNPLYTQDDISFDRNLPGLWGASGNAEAGTWKFVAIEQDH